MFWKDNILQEASRTHLPVAKPAPLPLQRTGEQIIFLASVGVGARAIVIVFIIIQR